jgi:hypothetical protein
MKRSIVMYGLTRCDQLVGLRNTVARDGMPWPDKDTYLVFLQKV